MFYPKYFIEASCGEIADYLSTGLLILVFSDKSSCCNGTFGIYITASKEYLKKNLHSSQLLLVSPLTFLRY